MRKNEIKGLSVFLAAAMLAAVSVSCIIMPEPVTEPPPEPVAFQPRITHSIAADNTGWDITITELPAMDFEAVGLVLTENEVEDGQGEMFTINELLRQAREMGAHDIINITLDRVRRERREAINAGIESTAKTTYLGSALAIRYTTALPPGTPLRFNTRPLRFQERDGDSLPLTPGSVAHSLDIGNQGGEFVRVTALPAKHFEVVGLVFTESVSVDGQGDVFTYYALMHEARELDAHGIINVNVETIQREELVGTGAEASVRTTIHHLGSALVIRYTDTLPPEPVEWPMWRQDQEGVAVPRLDQPLARTGSQPQAWEWF